MEFNSPQPEHAQLYGHILPKGGSTLYNGLQKAGGVKGSNSGSICVRGSSSTVSERPHGAGDTVRSSATDSKNGHEKDTSKDSLIPSPPLSPKLAQHPTSHAAGGEVKGDGGMRLGDMGEIVVTPSWDSEMTSKRYRYATHGFLSQYRLLGYGNASSNRPKRSTMGASAVAARRIATRYNNKSYASGSDFEKVYRTRRVTKNTGTPLAETPDLSTSATLSKSSPRASRKPKRIRPYQGQQSSSQLASTRDLHAAPIYVPNMSWEMLPDYSPPLSTLPANNSNKCLKVEWKGSSMDLSADPLRHKLHPAELVLAQTLRLPCDLYLDSKRRLFCEKVHRLKQGMPFRRTDAQKACRIDVNKASRLFAAYEKIGWLNDDNFAKYL
ncbi:HEL224Wp [Eremothecium sinecaudum]|uniref:HEL224Wp n=1 Tax=Eremothecium sinecaudum TaxID=45286 RepID=A0A0X8HTA2_9SACH|nr:HEL224Wp [Eremothecium sinecaudum]AMD21057.1 HEL224Wp [Eremothecium sinecaudum]